MRLLCGLVVAVMTLFPASDDVVADLYHRWMAAYENHLIQQMNANLEREAYEQKTGEEAEIEAHEAVLEVHGEGASTGSHDLDTPRSEQTPQESPVVVELQQAPLYTVDGEQLDSSVQEYLWQRLCEAGIGWFYEYALLIAYQESSFNILAVNPNQRDFGLYQYRVEYVPWMDWTNPYQQIDYFVQQMANRAAAGCTVSEMISRHNTSDYGAYNQSYVDAVMSHEAELVRIR